ncbi:tetratricopeptide repeat protein [Candidatus Shapirobacteria bacterium]|nr:tetratricopeptide repeat protein [Candidatus Shapirobacteria bacterium]
MAQKIKSQPKNLKTWFFNKTQLARRVGKPLAARANRWRGMAMVIFLFFLLGLSLGTPLKETQKIKNRLLNNPGDFNSYLSLAEKFIQNNQFEQAEQALLLAANLKTNSQVLGKTEPAKINQLWQKKQQADPQDLKRLISGWEQIVKQKPDYRDAYLQLAVFYYQTWQNEKAKEALRKALLIDPNFPPALRLSRLILP